MLFVADAKGSIREIILPKGLDLDRPKRTRTSFTAEQLYRLEMEFQRCQYVVGRERTELARQLNLSETQVYNFASHLYLLDLNIIHCFVVNWNALFVQKTKKHSFVFN